MKTPVIYYPRVDLVVLQKILDFRDPKSTMSSGEFFTACGAKIEEVRGIVICKNYRNAWILYKKYHMNLGIPRDLQSSQEHKCWGIRGAHALERRGQDNPCKCEHCRSDDFI